MTRTLSKLDQLIAMCDDGLRTVLGPAPRAERANPADKAADAALDSYARELSTRLMRINHAGEVSAQALYRGQAAAARKPYVGDKMRQAAVEENDHLEWTEARLRDLDGRTSYLNPVWYAGSFVIGALAGLAGDRWSLGFVAETEKQVVAHLDEHLRRLPQEDLKSRAIFEQMREDEGHHATVALKAGAAPLPGPIKRLMHFTSRIMTRTSYWI